MSWSRVLAPFTGIPHPELMSSLSWISFSFQIPYPCPNFGESRFAGGSQTRAHLTFPVSCTVFWSNSGILVIPCILDVNLIALFFSWFRKSERTPVMGREWVNIYFFNHCCLGRLGWSRRCWLYYGDQSVIQNSSIWGVAVTLSVRIIPSWLFPYDCLDHRNTFCDRLQNGQPEKTVDISRRHHWFLREITSEKRAQKFHTDDMSLPRSG